MADLATSVAGVELCNPFLLASGPLSHDGESIIRAHRAGAAAVVTKTISRRPAENPVPHIAVTSHGVLNRELWSDLSPDQWLRHEIPSAKAGGAVVIASLGPSARDVRELARRVAGAGADALELVTYDARELPRMVLHAVERTDLPVLAKVSANWPRADETALECLRLGAQGITAVDSLGPALRIDLRARRPVLGGLSCWLSGASLFPVALRAVAGIALTTGAPLIGTGGVATGGEALEMVMVGACAVGVCSLALEHGVGVFARLIQELNGELERLGYSTLRSAIGVALEALRAEAGPQPTVVAWHEAQCTGCGRCVQLCPYQARPDIATTDSTRCRLCGLCVSGCPLAALELGANRS